jgi:hypothetical protein
LIGEEEESLFVSKLGDALCANGDVMFLFFGGLWVWNKRGGKK